MAEKTEHYNLVKPDYADAADVEQINSNMDTIDGILWQLANAGADEELLKKVQEILDKIGETADTGGSYVSGSVMSKLNNIIIGNETNEAKIDTVLTILGTKVTEYLEAGIYNLELPTGLTKIKVTACGAGGGGAGTSSAGSAGGGGGGEAISEQEYDVTDISSLTITVGAGGKGGTSSSLGQNNGKSGGSTVIGNLVTLRGGNGGTFTNGGIGIGATAVGNGGSGGNGVYIAKGSTISGNSSAAGSSGLQGEGGKGVVAYSTNTSNSSASAGGGGGGSIGLGGNGQNALGNGSTPTKGGGGGGGAHGLTSTSMEYINGINGADGYVKIEWSVT